MFAKWCNALVQRVFSDWNSINRHVYDIAKNPISLRVDTVNKMTSRRELWLVFDVGTMIITRNYQHERHHDPATEIWISIADSFRFRRFTFVVALARLYHYRMIRYTAGIFSIRQFLEIVLVSIEETELINGASLNRTNKVPLSTFRPLIRRKLYVHRDISFCTFVRLPLHESRVIREAISWSWASGICLN